MDTQSARVISLSAADGGFSEIARLVDLYGSAVVALNDKPRYLVLDLNRRDGMGDASNQEVAEISRRLMSRNRAVYQELAK
jgi:antitoxin Phd